jgi:uncharacterized protein YjbJ (UPF0337 family)
VTSGQDLGTTALRDGAVAVAITETEWDMSGVDKAKNAVEDLGGKAKEAIGKVSGDHDTEAEGKADQSKADLKNAGEKVKDAFKN